MAARETRANGFAVLRDGDAVPPELRGAVVAIGNFDGVHLGHRRLIDLAREEAETRGRPPGVLTFEPHPTAYFRPEQPHFRLTPEPVKLKVLAATGIDLAFVRRFDSGLAATTAAAFIDDLIARELGIAALVVGRDFHFGRGREGSPATLMERGRSSDLGVTLADTVEVDEAPVSSSRIRAALAEGQVGLANRLLGYRWFVRGTVVAGAQLGRTLGYPTANISLGEGCRLAHGIYAVRVAVGTATFGGVASFGRRPTFDNGPPLLETYLFDFAGDLYGQEIEVEFLDFIRGEERFDSAAALVERMQVDEREARDMLARSAAAPSLIG